MKCTGFSRSFKLHLQNKKMSKIPKTKSDTFCILDDGFGEE